MLCVGLAGEWMYVGEWVGVVFRERRLELVVIGAVGVVGVGMMLSFPVCNRR